MAEGVYETGERVRFLSSSYGWVDAIVVDRLAISGYGGVVKGYTYAVEFESKSGKRWKQGVYGIQLRRLQILEAGDGK